MSRRLSQESVHPGSLPRTCWLSGDSCSCFCMLRFSLWRLLTSIGMPGNNRAVGSPADKQTVSGLGPIPMMTRPLLTPFTFLYLQLCGCFTFSFELPWFLPLQKPLGYHPQAGLKSVRPSFRGSSCHGTSEIHEKCVSLPSTSETVNAEAGLGTRFYCHPS